MSVRGHAKNSGNTVFNRITKGRVDHPPGLFPLSTLRGVYSCYRAITCLTEDAISVISAFETLSAEIT